MLWSLGKIRFATNAILFFLLFFVNSLICPPANQWPLIMEEIVVFLFIPATPLSWSRNPKGLSWTDTAPCSGPKLCPVYGFLNYRWTRIPSFACCPRLRGLRPPLRKANANNDFVLPSNLLSRMHWSLIVNKRQLEYWFELVTRHAGEDCCIATHAESKNVLLYPLQTQPFHSRLWLKQQ